MRRNFSMERGRSSRCLRAILMSCMALALFAGPTLGWAGNSNKNPSGHQLINKQRIHDLKERVADLREQLKEQKNHQQNGGGTPGSLQALETRVAALEATVAKFDPSTLIATLESLQKQIADMNDLRLNERLAALDNKTTALGDKVTNVEKSVVPDLGKYLSINTGVVNDLKGPHIMFHGVNVHVQSGTGTTADATSGLGNLIVGYNETATGVVRNGSHNIVGGQMNSFGSFGGLVIGMHNRISGQHAAVLGGGQNRAEGPYSTVVGGQQNTSSVNYDIKPQMQTSGGSTPPPAF